MHQLNIIARYWLYSKNNDNFFIKESTVEAKAHPEVTPEDADIKIEGGVKAKGTYHINILINATIVFN